MIEVCGFSKVYGRLLAVDHLSFEVRAGQVLGLIGCNGAGKTTTLRAIAGIIPPSSGEIRICGHSVAHNALTAKHHLAYVPDEPQLFDALTVHEHLEFFRMTYRLPPCPEVQQRLLRDFDLIDKEHVPADELSRGMRQKLGLCCAYLHAPRALLLDEPMVGLDPHGIRKLKASVAERAAAGAAVIVSSHMLAMVEDICTHVLMLHHGNATFCGPVEQMREQFGTPDTSSSLEHAFFRATEEYSRAVESA